MVVFTACGGDQLDQKATLNTNGNYETKTATDVQQIFNDEDMDCDSLLDGYRANFNVTVTPPGEEKMTVDVSLICTRTETKQNNEVINSTITIAMRIKIKQGDLNATTTLYMINYEDKQNESNSKEDIYMEVNSNDADELGTPNGKFKLRDENEFKGINSLVFEIAEGLIVGYNPANLNESYFSNSNTFKIAKSGDTTKVQIAIPATLITSASNMYYVFQNNVFQGFVLDEISSDFFGVPMTISATLSAFNDTIKLPNFNGYGNLPN